MQYNLAALAKTNRPFGIIKPTALQTEALYRLYLGIIRAWRSAASGMLAGYALAAQSGDAAAVVAELDQHNDEILSLIALIGFGAFFDILETWHRSRWLSSVSSAAGVDVGILLERPQGVTAAVNRAQRRAGGLSRAARAVRVTPQGLTPARTLTGIDALLAGAAAQNASLVRSVSDEMRARIASAAFSGVRDGKTVAQVAREINAGLKMSSKRARGIAADQVSKATKALTKLRIEEAGFDKGMWNHTPQEHPRIRHLGRDGEVYRLSDPVWAGLMEPNCKCWQSPAW